MHMCVVSVCPVRGDLTGDLSGVYPATPSDRRRLAGQMDLYFLLITRKKKGKKTNILLSVVFMDPGKEMFEDQ